MSFNTQGLDAIFRSSAQFELDKSENGKNVIQKIAHAKASVLLDYPFFGYIVGKLHVIPTTDATVEKYCVDFTNLYFSSNYVRNLIDVNSDWKEKLKGDIIHLILHLIYDHTGRKQVRNNKIWGFAADVVVYQMMRELSKQMNTSDAWGIPSFSQIPDDLLNLSVEKVYYMIIENLEEEKKSDQNKDQQKVEDRPELNIINISLNNIENEKSSPLPVNIINFAESTCNLDQAMDNGLGSDDVELQRSIINGIVRYAYERSKGRGELPSRIQLHLESSLKAKINWRVKLSNYLQKAIPVDTTWRRPNRKHISAGHYFPSMFRENINLLVAIDTSGSVDEIILKKFLTEIQMLVNQLSNTRIILVECDAEIHNIRIVHPGEKLIVKSIKGRGGTDFRPVFKLQQKYDIDVIIYFTDGEGVFPDKSILNIPVLWILSKDCPMPFGSVIVM